MGRTAGKPSAVAGVVGRGTGLLLRAAELRRLLALLALLPVLAELAVLLLAVGLCAELGSLLLTLLVGVSR